MEHALTCAKGGFVHCRHNEIRDLTATLLTEVCKDVRVEPELQPVTHEVLNGATANSQDGARLDIAANGVWGGNFERTYFDVRVFNPHAPTNRHTQLSSCYRKHEREKKRAYEQRVREVEHATFTPLVMAATGGLANEANVFYKRLASMLATKWDHSYSTTLCWLRCRLAFSLLRSSIQAIRGARSSRGHPIKPPMAIDLITSETNISPDFFKTCITPLPLICLPLSVHFTISLNFIARTLTFTILHSLITCCFALFCTVNIYNYFFPKKNVKNNVLCALAYSQSNYNIMSTVKYQCAFQLHKFIFSYTNCHSNCRSS